MLLYNRVSMDFSKLPILGGVIGWLDSEDVSFGTPLVVLGLLLFGVGLYAAGISQFQVVTFLFASAPLWLPFISFSIFFYMYMNMVGKKFIINSGRTIFEITLPAEIFKSPEAMEFVFTQIYNAATPDNLMETYLDGKRPLPYTFELVSKGGDVHFYATIPNKFKNGFMDNMYAQYPGVELRELDLDYTAEIPHDLKDWAMMSFHIGKKEKPVYPIKTYIDFGMDKLPKEEEKIDPMTPMLEMLSGIKPTQQMWIQFICIAHTKKNFKNGHLKKAGTWEKDAEEEINKIMQRDGKTKTGLPDLEGMPRITTGERDLIDAIDRNTGKYAFEVACRVIYLSKDPTDYDGGLFSRFIRTFAQTEIKGRNGMGVKWRTDFNYKSISDPFKKIIPTLKKEELAEYKKRVLYPKTAGMGYKTMSAEEMATLFHLPGKVAFTPTINRVPSTRGEAPSNLPIANLPE